MKYRIGQALYLVPGSSYLGPSRYVTIVKAGHRWLTLDIPGLHAADRKTLELKPRRGFDSPGRCFLTKEDYERWQRRHGAWRHFRRQVQDKWGPPESVTLEQIQAAADLLRLSAFA